MADLTLKILMEGVDRLTGPLKASSHAAAGLKGAVGGGEAALKDLGRAASALDGFGDKADRARQKANGLRAATEAAARLKTGQFLDRLSGKEAGPNKEAEATIAELGRLNAAAKRLDGFQALRDRAEASAAALKAAREEASRLGREHAALEKTTKKQDAAFEKARKAVTDLEAAHRRDVIAVQAARGELDRLGVSLRGGSAEAKSLEYHQRKIQAAMDSTTAAAHRQAQAIEQAAARERHAAEQAEAAARKRAEAQAQLDRTLQRSQALAVTGAAAFGTGKTILGTMAGAATPGIDFQAQMSKVGALVGVDKTSAEFAKLEAQAIQLGADTAFSASQAADAQAQLASSGFKTAQIVASLPAMLDLAKAAGFSEVGETATIAANTLNAFKLRADQMGDVGDILAHTFTSSATTLTDLGETMKYVGPIAQAAGYSFGDMAVAAGLLGNVGIKGSDAGTALRAMVTRIAAPTGEAAKMIAKLGVSTKDAAGNLLPLDQILEQVAAKTEKLGNGDRLAVMKTIFGEEASAAANTLVDQAGSGGIKDSAAKLRAGGKGTNSRIAGQMADNLKGDLDALGGSVETLGIVLEKLSDGPLRQITQKATEVVNAVTTWTKENPELAGTLTAVAAAIGVAFVVVGGLGIAVAGILGPLAMAKFAFLAVAPGIASFSAALLACPITWIVAAIAGAAYLIYRNWDGVLPWLEGMWESAGRVVSGVGDLIVGILTFDLARAASGLGNIFGGLGGLFGGWFGAVRGVFSGFAGWIDSIFGTTLKSQVDAVFDNIEAAFFNFTPLGIVIANWSPIVDYVRSLFDDLMGLFDRNLGWLERRLGDIKSAASFVTGLFGGGETGGAAPAVPANTNFPVANTNIPAGGGVSVAPTAAASAASARLTGAAATPVTNTSYNEITVHAAPGQDEKAIAREVARQMDERDRRAASASRSTYADRN